MNREFRDLELHRAAALQGNAQCVIDPSIHPCIERFPGLQQLSERPVTAEVVESGECRRCRSYFRKTGPACAHCRLEEVLLNYKDHLVRHKRRHKHLVSGLSQAPPPPPAVFEEEEGEREGVQQPVEGEVEGPFLLLMKHLRVFALRSAYKTFAQLSLAETARIEALKRELQAMVRLWDRHSELLKAHDELEQCKSTATAADYGLSLCAEGTLDQLCGLHLHSFEAAADCALDLRDALNNLTFYKHQVYAAEGRERDRDREGGGEGGGGTAYSECSICQEVLYGDTAPDIPSSSSSSGGGGGEVEVEVVMLPCAHQFHRKCVFRWVQTHRRCPLCKRTTRPTDLEAVLHSSGRERGRGRGVASLRQRLLVKGRWGTKVDALVGDVSLLLRDSARSGEKAIVFSQWPEVMTSLYAMQCCTHSCTR